MTDRNIDRYIKGNSYRDLSTVIVVPTLGSISSMVVQSWLAMMLPMNQKVARIFIQDCEVGDGYEQAIEIITTSEELKNFKYILTLEEDNIPPPDGLLRLYESVEKYDVIAGLYYTKGEEGLPLIYGNPKDPKSGFIPQIPLFDTIQECSGVGMGFTLFKTELFTKGRISKPFFKTSSELVYGQGVSIYTQDLYFCEKALRAGYKIACDTRVKVGHIDIKTGIIW